MQKNIRVLLASYSGRYSGMEHRILDEVNVLQERGANVEVATRQFPERPLFARELQRLHVPLHTLEPLPFLSNWPMRHLLYLRYRMRKPSYRWIGDYDVLRVFMPWSNRGLELIHVGSKVGVPIIVSAHNSFGTKPVNTRWHDKFLFSDFQSVKGIYGISSAALDDFIAKYGRYIDANTHLRVIQNAVNTDVFCPKINAANGLRSQLGLSQDIKIIGCVGRLSKNKRPQTVIEVFDRVQKRLQGGAHLVFVGDGEHKELVRSCISERGLDRYVTLLGQTNNIAEIMPAFDVHILLSTVEGFGQVNIEAMACGIPSVGTNVKGTNEVIRDKVDGFLVPANQTESACDRIVQILTDSGLALRFGKNARQRALETFSVAARGQKIESFYDEVLAASTFKGNL